MEDTCINRHIKTKNLKIITSIQEDDNNEEIDEPIPNSAQFRSPLLLGLPRAPTFFNLIRCNTVNSEFSPFCDFDVMELSIFDDFKECNQKRTDNCFEDYTKCLRICEKNEFEIVETFCENHQGKLIPALMRIRAAVIECSKLICHKSAFRYFIFFTIIVNTIFLALEDQKNSKNYDSLQLFFLVIYTVEFILKIFSKGIFQEKNAYFRKKWNFVDFVVLVTFWLDFVGNSQFNLQILRALRILRPLKSISSLKGLRLIVISVGISIRPLLAAMSLFLLLIFIFAIAGMQLWSGLFYYKCMDLHTGFITADTCGSFDCPIDYKCVRSLDNPNLGITNFDNILFASLTVYQCITLEGWISIMQLTDHAFSSLTLIYFLPLVFFGALIFLNLFLVIIKSALSKTISKGLSVKKLENQLVDSRDLSNQYIGFSNLDENSPSPEDLSEQSKYSPIRSSQFTVLNQGSGDSAMENENQSKSFQFGSDKTKKKDQCSSDDLQYLENYVKTNTPHLWTIFNKMNNKISVTCAALDKINKGDKFLKTKAMIKEYPYESSSTIDLKPLSKMLTADNFIKTESKVFVYKDATELMENPIRCWENSKEVFTESFPASFSDFQIFNKLTTKYNEELAFELINYPVSGFCRKLENIEKQTNYIEGIWSGPDVAYIKDLALMSKFNEMNYLIWSQNYWAIFEKCRHPFKKLIESRFFNVFIILCVICNTVVLSIDHYGITVETQNILLSINLAFTSIFILEMGLKILVLGFKGYLKDSMNYFDGSIVILSIVELAFTSGTKSVISAFRTARVFRIFKVLRILRIAKIFRYLQSMAHILAVIAKSVSKYIYIGLLLFILIMVYSILGMQIFAGKFNTNEKTRTNFDDFHWSFVTNFQIMTVENWQNILYTTMNSEVGYASCIYLISWIVLGNYIILNLFLAILLENFSENEVEEAVKFRKQRIFEAHSLRMTRKIEQKMKIIQEMNSDSEDEEYNSNNSLKNIVMADTSKSLYIFDLKNKVRQFCISVTFSQKFEYFILGVILLSSIKLAIDTYLSANQVTDFEIVDYIFSSIFIIEFILKIVSRGFCMSSSSYLRDSWNYIDFIVVISSLIDFTITGKNLTQVKVVRLLRTLRPFRYINYNYSMKIVLVCLLQSIVAILNVIIVQIIVILMFAILGVSLFAGKLYVCSNPIIDTRLLCEQAGYTWQAIWPNFDNVWNTFVTLIILSSMEGWPDIMNTAIDATDVDQGPKYNNNPYVAYYFIVFITISSFLFMNLFVGVIYEKFNEARKTESSLAASILTKEQMLWIEMQKHILRSSPTSTKSDPKNKFQNICIFINDSTYFQVFVAIMIISNMLFMSFFYEGASSEFVFALDTCNLIFSALFAFEAFIKIMALGLYIYFKSFSNAFDFIVVCVSCLDIILTYAMGSELKLLRRGPQMIRIIKVFRISKFIRLFRILKPLKKLVDIIIYSLPAFGNIMALLVLIFYIYAIIGFQLFGDLSHGFFSTFSVAMLTLFRCSTGEDWPTIMFKCGEAQGMFVAQLYFLSFIGLVVFIVVNLFIMVIIQNYEDYEKNPETVENVFEQHLEPIKKIWNFYSKNENEARVHIQYMVEMIRDLSEFGIGHHTSQDKIIQFLKILHLEGDKEGYIYYHNFLYAVFRRKFLQKCGGKHFRKIIVNEEKSTKMKIAEITMKQQKKFARRKNSDVTGIASAQYFIEKVYMKTLLRAWRNYVKSKIEKRKLGNCLISLTPREYDLDFPGENTIFEEG